MTIEPTADRGASSASDLAADYAAVPGSGHNPGRTDELRLAYADPPYWRKGRLYDAHHPDSRKWDDQGAHLELLAQLEQDYDGWAYSCNSTHLEWVLPAVPGARVAAWCKPFCSWLPRRRQQFTWEPVVFRPGRTVGDNSSSTRDYLCEPMTLRRGLPGAKPEAFARWVLDLLGYQDGDELVDLFPGTGVLTAVQAQGVLL